MSRIHTAKILAKSHARVEPEIQTILRVVAIDEADEGGSEPVKLLEVNPSTVPVGIQPVYFTPDYSSGIRYTSVVIEVTPEEFEQIKNKTLALPAGWQIADTLYVREAEAA